MIGVKVTPDADDQTILAILETVASINRTYINVGNTTFRSCTSIGMPANRLSVGGGGLSGPTLFPRTLSMIELVKSGGIPVVATGGIHNFDTAYSALKSGADLVGMATALVLNPFLVPDVNQRLSECLRDWKSGN